MFGGRTCGIEPARNTPAKSKAPGKLINQTTRRKGFLRCLPSATCRVHCFTFMKSPVLLVVSLAAFLAGCATSEKAQVASHETPYRKPLTSPGATGLTRRITLAGYALPWLQAFGADADAVTRGQDEVADAHLALHQVEPRPSPLRELVHQVLPGVEHGRVHQGVLVDAQRSFASVRRGDDAQPVPALRRAEASLLIA